MPTPELGCPDPSAGRQPLEGSAQGSTLAAGSADPGQAFMAGPYTQERPQWASQALGLTGTRNAGQGGHEGGGELHGGRKAARRGTRWPAGPRPTHIIHAPAAMFRGWTVTQLKSPEMAQA